MATPARDRPSSREHVEPRGRPVLLASAPAVSEREEHQAAAASAPSEEAAIIARVQRGDVAAFDAIVRRHLSRALIVARGIMRQREDAEDLVQEAFMTALERIDSFDVSRPFAPWLMRIVVTRGINALRANRVRRTESLTDGDAVAAESLTPDEALERAEVRERFAAAVAELPERQRRIITMFEVDGRTTAEIAGEFGLTSATVRWYIFEARRALRRALEPLRPRSGRAQRGATGESHAG